MPVVGEDTVDEEFLKVLNYVEVDVEIPDQEQNDVVELQRELSRIQGRMERLEELYIEGDIPKKKYRERLEDEKEKESALMQTLNGNEAAVSPEMVRKMISDIKLNWSYLELEDKKKAIHSIFSKLTVECLSTHKGGKGQRATIEFTQVESIL